MNLAICFRAALDWLVDLASRKMHLAHTDMLGTGIPLTLTLSSFHPPFYVLNRLFREAFNKSPPFPHQKNKKIKNKKSKKITSLNYVSGPDFGPKKKRYGVRDAR